MRPKAWWPDGGEKTSCVVKTAPIFSANAIIPRNLAIILRSMRHPIELERKRKHE